MLKQHYQNNNEGGEEMAEYPFHGEQSEVACQLVNNHHNSQPNKHLHGTRTAYETQHEINDHRHQGDVHQITDTEMPAFHCPLRYVQMIGSGKARRMA